MPVDQTADPAPRWQAIMVTAVGALLCAFTLTEVNYPRLSPQSQLAIFAMLGIVLCFLTNPAARRFRSHPLSRAGDGVLAVLTVLTCGYFVVQTEPAFSGFWINGQSLGNRAGSETALDFAVGGVLALLVLEATRRSIGIALPLLALMFAAYGLYGTYLPDWLLPHRGYTVGRTVSQAVLQGQGIFGVALQVMFTYVFLFVIFGAFLKGTGAIGFIIDFAKRLFSKSVGGAAKVSVLSSGLMGSLSGSAVANTVTTGTFTIPMMRASGYSASMAGGIEAAASSGGALVPPVMGAAAYMMLEIVSPPVTYLQIVQAAILPAILFYFSLFLIVHFHSKRLASLAGTTGTLADFDAETSGDTQAAAAKLNAYAGIVFGGAFFSLLGFLFAGFSPFRAVSLSLVVIILLASFHHSTRLTFRTMLGAMRDSARDVIPLVCAAACVGIIIGVVTLTGVGTRFPSLILPIAEDSLFLALLLIMFTSIILGMGLPSVVCYLLLATLIGDVLGDLGVVPLAGHMFIFYFGMLSMVTPPVALAAFAASSVAGSPVMATAFAAFRFSLVGFFLPFMFVFRPELLMLDHDGSPAVFMHIAQAFGIAAVGVTAFAIGIAGHYFHPVSRRARGLFFLASGLLLFPGNTTLWQGFALPIHDLAGGCLFIVLSLMNARSGTKPATAVSSIGGSDRR
jgi:TRAP transporter 4TM/12TM fusion protein